MEKMNYYRKLFFVVMVAVLIPFSIANAAINLLHEFAGGSNDGMWPFDSLIQDGSVLFGTTYGGGDYNYGVVFKVNKDGSGFQILHEFDANTANPETSLIQDGSMLYGTTYESRGVVYKMHKDGSGFQVVHQFIPEPNDGEHPGTLIQDVSVLYGMTSHGGGSGVGVVYKVNKDGSGFQILHQFTGGSADGAYPFGSLIQDGSVLYGMTSSGGDYNYGVVFEINTNGSGFQILHEFAGGSTDGASPFGSLIQDGSVLYGMTSGGGDYNYGVAFKINTNGSGFQILHEFAGGSADGWDPSGSLIQDGSILYGMTLYGGDYNYGVAFKINTNGSGFEILHEFAGGSTDGASPSDSLIQDGSVLYGMTGEGGDFNKGVVFSLTLPCTAPQITTQPQSQTIQSGQSTTLSVTAQGTTLSYQWYMGFSPNTSNPINGATSSSYRTPALTQTTSYWVRVSNSCGSANSNTATITVSPAPPTNLSASDGTYTDKVRVTWSAPSSGPTPLATRYSETPLTTVKGPLRSEPPQLLPMMIEADRQG